MTQKAVYLTVSLLLTLIQSQVIHAAPPDRRDSDVLPSISSNTVAEQREAEMSWGYLCYSFRTGAPLGCTIMNHTLFTVEQGVFLGIKSAACVYDFDGTIVPDTCADGGHEHVNISSVRPQSRIFDPSGTAPARVNNSTQPLNLQAPLIFDAPDGDPNTKFNVKGEMAANRWVFVKYPTPDNAGSFYWQAQIQPPPCFFLARLCGFVGRGAQDNGTKIWDGTVNVGVKNLRQLPEIPDLYNKLRGNEPDTANDDTRHPDRFAFAGTPRAHTAMQLIAFQYNLAHSKLLQPNDMSLPLGGLFDVLAAYNYSPEGHATHRDGQDIDLNRISLLLDNNGSVVGEEETQCENDIELFEAVNKVLVPVPGALPRQGPLGSLTVKETALLCETLDRTAVPEIFGFKHIDVTTIDFPPFQP